MGKILKAARASFWMSVIACGADAQVTLTGSAYLENFNGLGTALPTGWSVYTNATGTSYGTGATFTTSPTAWNSAASGTFFRNVASDDIAISATATAQGNDTNRGLGWRPLNAGSRDGSVVFELANTSGYKNFNLSVDLFTGNNAGATNQTYTLEFRIGNTGAFTPLGTYTTTAPFGATTLTANSITLSALDNQSGLVAFRFRNASGASDSSYDSLVIDNFALTYSAIAVPESGACAAVLGVIALVGAAVHRRRKVLRSHAQTKG